jgi:Domain of unknown function (DUF4157)
MHENDRAEGSPEPAIALGERWRLPALDMLRRWATGRRWLQFSAAVEERHLAVFVRSAARRMEQGHGLAPGSRAVATVPPPIRSGGLTAPTGALAATALERSPSGAPGSPDRPWRPRPLPRTEADLAVPGRAIRAGFAGRSVAAEEGEQADARAGHDRVDERLIAGALDGFARTLEPRVQGYLSRLLDLRIPAVRIHTGQAADAAARRLNADAVSFGRSIMFRSGRFDPDSAAGLGLLGHELTHVAQAGRAELDQSAGARGGAALAREELAAIENERRVLQHATWRPVAPVLAPAREPASGASKAAPSLRAASVDRGVTPPRPEAVSSAPEITPQQLGALQEAIYRDLMDRIRTEFERGA